METASVETALVDGVLVASEDGVLAALAERGMEKVDEVETGMERVAMVEHTRTFHRSKNLEKGIYAHIFHNEKD